MATVWALTLAPLAAAAYARAAHPVEFPRDASPLQPPPRTFAVVWSTIYLLLGAFLARTRHTAVFRYILPLALLNMALNLSWPHRTYRGGADGVRDGWLAIHAMSLTVVAMMILAGPDRLAQLMLTPYLVWLHAAAGLLQTSAPPASHAATGDPITSNPHDTARA
jgi:tryptophan-rich sensory protein